MRQSLPSGRRDAARRPRAPQALLVLAVIAFVSAMGISIMLPSLPLHGLSLGAVRCSSATSGFAIANGVPSAANSAGNVIGPAFGGLPAVASDLRTPFAIVAAAS